MITATDSAKTARRSFPDSEHRFTSRPERQPTGSTHCFLLEYPNASFLVSRETAKQLEDYFNRCPLK